MNFEPYASKYDNKLLIDAEGNGDVIGVMQRPKDPRAAKHNSSELSHNIDDASTIDMKFEFQGPRRTSDERHYFSTVQENYADRIKTKKNSLDAMLDEIKRPRQSPKH